jgi:hypothetical protein
MHKEATTTALISPTINLNGSDRDYLVAERRAAMDILEDAIGVLARINPHGRDYPADYDRCLDDRQTHFARIQALRALQEALYTEAVAIQQQ